MPCQCMRPRCRDFGFGATEAGFFTRAVSNCCHRLAIFRGLWYLYRLILPVIYITYITWYWAFFNGAGPKAITFLTTWSVHGFMLYVLVAAINVLWDRLCTCARDGAMYESDEPGELAQMNNGSNFQWAEQQEDRNKLWKARHNVWYAGLALRPGSKGLATDVCVPISRLPSVIVETKEDLKQCSFIGTIVGHVGDGNFHTIVVFDPESSEELEQVRGFNERLVRRALDAQGTCTGEHGVGLGKREFLVEEVGEPAINTMRMIKRAFDSLNMMNPGKVLLPE